MKIEIETADGIEQVELDLDLNKMTMKESVLLEEALGADRFDALLRGEGAARPTTIRAVAYAKLKSKIPGLELEEFDFDLSGLTESEEVPLDTTKQ